MDIPRYPLNDGHDLPVIGFGTAGLRGDDAVAAVSSALDTGYRLIDTAVNYQNETEVGEAIRRSGVPRDDILVTSKIPGRHHGYDDAIRSTKESLERLGIDRLDLHLIHWPNPGRDRYHEAWRALVDLQRDGLVRSIGVSNFTHDHLRRIVDETGVTPASTRSSCTRTSRSRRCSRWTTTSASSPSRGARSASGRRRSPSRRSPLLPSGTG